MLAKFSNESAPPLYDGAMAQDVSQSQPGDLIDANALDFAFTKEVQARLLENLTNCFGCCFCSFISQLEMCARVVFPIGRRVMNTNYSPSKHSAHGLHIGCGREREHGAVQGSAFRLSQAVQWGTAAFTPTSAIRV